MPPSSELSATSTSPLRPPLRPRPSLSARGVARSASGSYKEKVALLPGVVAAATYVGRLCYQEWPPSIQVADSGAAIGRRWRCHQRAALLQRVISVLAAASAGATSHGRGCIHRRAAVLQRAISGSSSGGGRCYKPWTTVLLSWTSLLQWASGDAMSSERRCYLGHELVEENGTDDELAGENDAADELAVEEGARGGHTRGRRVAPQPPRSRSTPARRARRRRPPSPTRSRPGCRDVE